MFRRATLRTVFSILGVERVPDPKPLTDVDYSALAEFRYLLRRFLAFSEAKASEMGLTPQQHQALLAVRSVGRGTATVGLVAERLLLRPHSATGLINRLVALGLLNRSTSEEDRRRSVLNLTEKANDLISRLTAVHRADIERLRPLLQDVLKQINTVETS